MKTKKYKPISIASLILAILPLFTLIPVFLGMELSQSLREAWTIFNICTSIGAFLASMFCVVNKTSRSYINIFALILSLVWILLMGGIYVNAMFMNYMDSTFGSVIMT